MLLSAGACSKSKSYSELLKEEEKATNWYLSNQVVISEVPADSVFITGEDAPYYKLDEEGYVYMQVINPGDKSNMAKTDQPIYFRYLRTNIINLYNGTTATPSGNANDVGNGNSTYFRFNNTLASSSQLYGAGIQYPLRYLGVDCEVNLVLRSYYGFDGETGQCQPYLYNIRYYPAYY
jgi:hypothetical protein